MVHVPVLQVNYSVVTADVALKDVKMDLPRPQSLPAVLTADWPENFSVQQPALYLAGL